MLFSPPPPLPLILASTSPWRRSICAQAGLDVEGVAPRCDEKAIQDPDPVALALARATAKAESVRRADAIVIGSDQVCHLGARVFHKPTSAADHLAQLQALRGQTHTLSNGVCVLAPNTEVRFVVDVRVRLRAELGDDELSDYVASGDAAGCAGGYRAEGVGAALVERIEGDWFSVLGLPIFDLITTLRSLGWRPRPLRHTSGSPPLGMQL